MPTLQLPESIAADIRGNVSGQVAVGNYILQIGSVHGGVVNVTPPERQTAPQPRPSPVLLLPRRPEGALLGRRAEVDQAVTALKGALPAEFHGPAGLGKTSLLRYLAHSLRKDFADGVVYLSARQQPAADILQALFEAFHESAGPYKATAVQIRRAFLEKSVFILLDDVDLPREEVNRLLNEVPGCTLLLASAQRRLWGEGKAIALRGLSVRSSVKLIEREWGRPLTPREQQAAESLATALGGNPLRLLEALAAAADAGHSLSELANRVRTETTPVARPSDPERRVLSLLAALGGSAVGAAHLGILTELHVDTVLDELVRRQWVREEGDRYRRYRPADQVSNETDDPAAAEWAEPAFRYFLDWAEQQADVPERLADEAEVLHYLLGWAERQRRWADVLRLGVVLEDALAVGGRWGAWEQVLGAEIRAAEALRDRAALARARHQEGTRSLCLGSATQALASLQEALQLRTALGDKAGARVTLHNLNLLRPQAPPVPVNSRTHGGSPGRSSTVARLMHWGTLPLTFLCFLAMTGTSGTPEFPRPAPLPPPAPVVEGPGKGPDLVAVQPKPSESKKPVEAPGGEADAPQVDPPQDRPAPGGKEPPPPPVAPQPVEPMAPAKLPPVATMPPVVTTTPPVVTTPPEVKTPPVVVTTPPPVVTTTPPVVTTPPGVKTPPVVVTPPVQSPPVIIRPEPLPPTPPKRPPAPEPRPVPLRPLLVQFNLHGKAVESGRTIGGVVTLDRPAPPGGLRVQLASDNPAKATPLALAVLIPEGRASTSEVQIRAGQVEKAEVVQITATYGGDSRVAPLVIQPKRTPAPVPQPREDKSKPPELPTKVKQKAPKPPLPEIPPPNKGTKLPDPIIIKDPGKGTKLPDPVIKDPGKGTKVPDPVIKVSKKKTTPPVIKKGQGGSVPIR